MKLWLGKSQSYSSPLNTLHLFWSLQCMNRYNFANGITKKQTAFPAGSLWVVIGSVQEAQAKLPTLHAGSWQGHTCKRMENDRCESLSEWTLQAFTPWATHYVWHKREISREIPRTLHVHAIRCRVYLSGLWSWEEEKSNSRPVCMCFRVKMAWNGWLRARLTFSGLTRNCSSCVRPVRQSRPNCTTTMSKYDTSHCRRRIWCFNFSSNRWGQIYGIG